MTSQMIHWSMLVEFVTGASALFLFRRRGAGAPLPASAGRLVGCLVAAAVAMACKIGYLRRGELDFFGLLNVIYLNLVVVAPMLGLLAILEAAWRRRQSASRSSRAASLLRWTLLACAGVGVYASWIEPRRLQVERASHQLRAGRVGTASVRLGVLADLQTDRITEYEHEAVRQLLALVPDIILIPGDFFQASREEFEQQLPDLRALAARLTAPFGVYFVLGNTDGSRTDLQRVFDGTEVRILKDEFASVTVRDRELRILGVDRYWNSRQALAAIKDLEGPPEDGTIRIAVTHYPDVIYKLEPHSRIDLVVAGHTHGGQVQVPLLGPPIVLSKVPRFVGAGGLHSLDGRALYISRGVGMERLQAPRIRFFCPPEVTLIELKS